MYGQTNSYEEQTKTVDEYISRTDPYKKQEPLGFDLREYARYIEEHSISPEQVTAEMWDRFSLREQKLS